jgi:hypothetical protein
MTIIPIAYTWTLDGGPFPAIYPKLYDQFKIFPEKRCFHGDISQKSVISVTQPEKYLYADQLDPPRRARRLEIEEKWLSMKFG